MKTIPIAFAFDDNLMLPACISISSLLMNANKDTFYDIFLLHNEKDLRDKTLFDKLKKTYSNCRINYIKVDNTFDNAFEIRGITTPAYYRLLIPQLITEYDKVIYADADIIFRFDLSSLYDTEMYNNYIAATYDWGMILNEDGQKYIESVEGLTQGEYIQSGFLLIHSAQIRKDNLVPQFIEAAKHNYKFQDQDILNIFCGMKRIILPIKYNMTDYAFYFATKEPERLSKYCTSTELQEAKLNGTLHFNGHKPWKKISINFDIWWEYYRHSPFYDERYYFDFFHSKLNELDLLPFWKRVKILLRYFIYPPKK